MKKYLAAPMAAVGVVALAFSTVSAGVVVTRTESVVSGQIGPKQEPHETTTMIEGNKEKMVLTGGRAVIVDLDKSTMQVVDPAKKMYFEVPFPPKGMMGQAIGGPALHVSDFTKSGKSRTIAGFPCDDYNGTGQLPMGHFNTVYCVSTKAPGAVAFSAFQKNMIAKLKTAQPGLPSSVPDGIPLAEDTTTQMAIMNFGNLAPDMAAKLKAQLANRPPVVTKAEVTKVEEKKIEASEFAIPADYTKREPMMGRMGGMAPHPMPMPGAGGNAAGAAPLFPAPAAGAPPAGGQSSLNPSGGAPPSGPSSSLNQ
jgi:hypothetical protein